MTIVRLVVWDRDGCWDSTEYWPASMAVDLVRKYRKQGKRVEVSVV